MRLSPIPLLTTLILAGTLPVWADPGIPSGPCHDVDMYGIYKICGTPDEQHHEDRRETVVQPVYMTIPEPVLTPAPPIASIPTSFGTDNDFSRRELTAVDTRLHDLHLLLDDKQSQGQIGASFFDEENRYLAQIQDREQSAANANGGYLTEAQENSLLQQLQDVENEINNAPSNNG
jgi:hypothetical protein